MKLLRPVTCVASNASMKLLRPDYLKWATGNKVITKLTGSLEHIRIAEKNTSDIIVVYPCTANNWTQKLQDAYLQRT